MAKKLFVVLIIIFGNLFAFLIIGHILDSLLNYKVMMKIFFIVISIVPLIFFMFSYVKKAQTEFEKIKEIKK